jgi:hypothetical protein
MGDPQCAPPMATVVPMDPPVVMDIERPAIGGLEQAKPSPGSRCATDHEGTGKAGTLE